MSGKMPKVIKQLNKVTFAPKTNTVTSNLLCDLCFIYYNIVYFSFRKTTLRFVSGFNLHQMPTGSNYLFILY